MERILLHSSTLILIFCIMTSHDFGQRISGAANTNARFGVRRLQENTRDIIITESDGRHYHGEHCVGILGLVE